MPSSYPAPAVTSLESGKRQPWKSMVGAYMPTVTTDFGKDTVNQIRLNAQIDMHGSIRLAGMADLKG